MDLWLVIALIAGLATLWMAAPFFRGRIMEIGGADDAISIYRDQIDEVERDAQAGLIGQQEAEAARVEIERRALHAARNFDSSTATSTRAPVMGMGLTLLAAGGAIALYAALGAPQATDQPLAERRAQILTQRAAAGDVTSRIQLLIEETRSQPESFDTWWTLAKSYTSVGDHASATDAYRRAAELSNDRPGVLSAYAESMTLANGNKVPQAARLIFERITRDTADPRALYYLALSKAQQQDFEGALQGWTELAQASGPDAPWMPLARRDIVNMARFLKADVTDYLPDASPEEVAAAGGEGLAAPSVGGVGIATLESRLADDPMDHQSWIELARLRALSGDEIGAAAAIGEARRHFAAAPFVIGKLDEAERALGLDLVPPPAGEGPRGPDAEDIAAAAQMSQADRDAMIAGMVAGLAARLDEEPNDPDGWAMLIRSYRTMGEPGKAEAARDRALEIFADQPAILRQIEPL